MANEFCILDSDIEISGMRIRARRLQRAGHGSGKPVLVFLHEALGCIDMWRDFPIRLAWRCGFEAFVFDRLGHGASDPLPSLRADSAYLFREAWESLPKVLDASGISRPVFFGHSDGGTLALLFAARFPERCSGIVSEAAHVFVDDLTTEGIRRTIASYHETGTEIREKLLRYHGANLENIFRRWANTWLSDEFQTWNIEAELPKVKCPVLAVQGADDGYGTEAQVDSIVRKSGGIAQKLIIPDCGHIPHHQATETVLEEAGRFISRLTG
jgi:pimeloyl-ACP methyl ester carboxylesterase